MLDRTPLLSRRRKRGATAIPPVRTAATPLARTAAAGGVTAVCRAPGGAVAALLLLSLLGLEGALGEVERVDRRVVLDLRRDLALRLQIAPACRSGIGGGGR